MTSSEFYTANLLKLQQDHAVLLRKKSALGMLRFGSIAAMVAVFYFLYSFGWQYVLGGAVMLIIVFIQLVYRDLANKAAIEHLAWLIQINRDELLALDGQYRQFSNGMEHNPKDHFYANDLDIFGQASLFQFLNRTTSEFGSGRLAHWLLTPASPAEVAARQESVMELSKKTGWRQKLQAFGKVEKIKQVTLVRLTQWLGEPSILLQFKPWQVLRYLLPAIILCIAACSYFDLLSMSVFYYTLSVYAVIAFQINKVIAPVHRHLSLMVKELEALAHSIAVIEAEHFISPRLKEMQSEFSEGTGTASEQLKRLKKMLDRLDMRYNIVLSAPLNLFLLWNLQQVLDLEKWKLEHNASIGKWFNTLGSFEALNCLATLHFNNGWPFPVLTENHFHIEATGLGHPLINAGKRVDNFIGIHRSGDIMLITGSNMAGKSTYLRSVGVNVVLAMAGSPVCAASLSVSPVQLISSMRIADNLEESTSTFYAELKKLKTVIDMVNNGEKVFVLLDEILRGTNSIDRHTGSVALVKQLIKKHAAAIIATHDIALADLKVEFPENILNYHFDVQVNNEELFFDYKLKPGICTSMNASILMKKIGIEL